MDAKGLRHLRQEMVLAQDQVEAVLAVVAGSADAALRQEAMQLLEDMVEDLDLGPLLLALEVPEAHRSEIDLALSRLAKRLVGAGAPEPAEQPGEDAPEGSKLLWRLRPWR